MKNKDFGFFQQHVEKIALGIGGVVLLGVGATQFLGAPNAIELDSKQVGPGEIQETVTRQANLLKGKLAGEGSIEPIVIPRYAELFQKHLNLPVATDQKLAPIDNTGLASIWQKPVSPDYPQKVLPTPPVPFDVLAKSGHGVLADDGSDRYFALQQIIGEKRPADFTYVSVSANFSFADLMERYRATDVPGEQRIEEGLWRERLAITSVQLLREELDPITGEWGNATTINPLPGQFAIVPEFQPTLTFEESQDLEARIRSSQPDIRRSAFPPIQNGPWTPPDIANRVYTSEELQQRDELQRKITQLERQLDRLTGNDERDRDQGRDGRGSRRGDNNDGIEYGDFEAPRGSSRDRRGSRGDREDDNETDRRADRNAERVTNLENELATTQRELNELLGIDEEELGRSAFDGPRGPSSGSFDRSGDSEFNQGFDPSNLGNGSFRGPTAGRTDAVPEEIKVWAHDLKAKPGKTYRYKVLVSVMNPLYRIPRLNPKQLAENRNRISLGPSQEEIDAAEWSPSATVELDPAHYYFVTSGSKEQKRAEIEVWTVYNGIWRKSEFTEYPGNEVGGSAEIPGVDTGGRGVSMNVGPIVLDVDSITASNGRPAVRVLFIDPETNRITTRLVNDDKNSDDRKRLELEADLQSKQAENRLSDSR